jgi:DNA (cytosine-5)-methyltransferase 1
MNSAKNQKYENSNTAHWFTNEQISCIDLFCGVGGLTHGLIRGGIKVLAGLDLDSQCRFPYEHNNNALFIERDIKELSSDELVQMFGDSKLRLLAGCAPCQPFSTYSRKGREVRNDTKWGLVSDFGRLVRDTQPDLVTMENVPQILDHEVFQNFLKDLKDYSISWRVLNCEKYGVPQTRKRLVLIASRLGEIELLIPNSSEKNIHTVRKAISHLRPLKAGCSDPQDRLHTASSLSTINLQRIKSSRPGGTWRDWDESLLAPCHRKQSGQTYPSVYGRMEWDAPAPTITTQCFGYGNGRFGHPEQDRAISLREAAILQTFPEDYVFVAPEKPVIFDRLGRLIGNAVPVRLGEIVAESLLTHLNSINVRDRSSTNLA